MEFSLAKPGLVNVRVMNFIFSPPLSFQSSFVFPSNSSFTSLNCPRPCYLRTPFRSRRPIISATSFPADDDATIEERNYSIATSETNAIPLVVLRRLVQLRETLTTDNKNILLSALADAFTKANDTITSTQQQFQQQQTELKSLFSSITQTSPFPSQPQLGQPEKLGEVERDEAGFYRIPKTPKFDPITGLILAVYAFQAYTDPTPNTYHQIFKTFVEDDNSNDDNTGKEQVRKVILTDIYYLHAPMIAATATGVFLLSFNINYCTSFSSTSVLNSPSNDNVKEKPIIQPTMPPLTVSINGAFSTLSSRAPIITTTSTTTTTTVTDPTSTPTTTSTRKTSTKTTMKASSSVTLLRLQNGKLARHECDDVLHVCLQQPASHEAIIHLDSLVKDAVTVGESRSKRLESIDLTKKNGTVRDIDFFQSPDFNLNLSSFFSGVFGGGKDGDKGGETGGETDDNNNESTVVTAELNAGFVPFPAREMKKALMEVEIDSQRIGEIDEQKRENMVADFLLATRTISSLTLIDDVEASDGKVDEQQKIDEETVATTNQEEEDGSESLQLEARNGKDDYNEEDSQNGKEQQQSILSVKLSDIRLPTNSSPEIPQVQLSPINTSTMNFNLPNPSNFLSNFFKQTTPSSPASNPTPVPTSKSNYTSPSPTRLPVSSEWIRLSHACHTIVDILSSKIPIPPRTSTLRESSPAVLFLENNSTDTQVLISLDEPNKNVVISFRGTEQLRWRDLLTDAQLFLQVWAPGDTHINLEVSLSRTVGLRSLLPSTLFSSIQSNKEQDIGMDTCAVHFGFLQAYMSIRDALRHALGSVLSVLNDKREYTFHFTGHSLGGALATLSAADFKVVYDLPDDQVICMTYGSPKVGNANFARRFNELVPNAFRVVNDADVIPRLPNSIRGEERLYKYHHAGRTVIVNDDGEIWVEGIHDEELKEDEGVGWSWRGGQEALQELVKFENTPLPEVMSGKAVKQHMVSIFIFILFLTSLEFEFAMTNLFSDFVCDASVGGFIFLCFQK